MMTLKQLETFYWVARLRGFVLAAERLNSTQATVSMRIKDLEESLGVTLFDRSQRSAQLTPKGKELLAYAAEMIALATRIQDRVCDPEVLSVIFRLGVTELVAATWLPDLMRMINTTYPRVTIQLDVNLTMIQQRKLANGELDLAILPGAPEVSRSQSVALGIVRCTWMASPKLEIRATDLAADQIAQWPILMMTPESNLNKTLETWFDRNNVSVQCAYMCNSIGVLGMLVEAGLGVGYLPRLFFERQLDAATLHALDVSPVLPDLKYYAVFKKDCANPLADRIAELAHRCSTFEPS
ncbi:MAG: LysR family transcriptional regulator [Fimbriimonadaceae bacterium]|nr:LysR family transcriptional regulator [Alphaproteobacteria bacterium]